MDIQDDLMHSLYEALLRPIHDKEGNAMYAIYTNLAGELRRAIQDAKEKK